MPTIKTLKRYSSKKYSRRRKKKSVRVRKSDEELIFRADLFSLTKIYPSHKNRLVYTYILKDIKKGIYKIGKTANPHSRFKALCKFGEVMPIALVKKDVENILHKRFADNRIFNKEYRNKGGTEWFKKGGKFTEFIEKIDTGRYLPYITVHNMVEQLIETGKIRFSDSTVEWEAGQYTYGYYCIGLEILKITKYVSYAGKKLTADNNEDALITGNKISISHEVLKDLSDNYVIFMASELFSPLLQESKNETSRFKKLLLDKDYSTSEVFLLINKVL